LKTQTQYALLFGLAMFLLLTLFVYRAYRQKQKSNAQIKTLMSERQHRAKNNLQIVIELLGLQSALVEHEQAKGAIKSSESRMLAVSLIDRMLYQNAENTEIDMREYTQKLVENLVLVFSNKNQYVNISLDAGYFSLDASKATPLGLIMNELVTNSFKYAFTGNPAPALKIGLQKSEGGEVVLCYLDNGPGLDEQALANKTISLGLKLIRSLSKQLKGTLTMEKRDGFYFELIFKV
jgi:two-component sensor histidine kinase